MKLAIKSFFIVISSFFSIITYMLAIDICGPKLPELSYRSSLICVTSSFPMPLLSTVSIIDIHQSPPNSIELAWSRKIYNVILYMLYVMVTVTEVKLQTNKQLRIEVKERQFQCISLDNHYVMSLLKQTFISRKYKHTLKCQVYHVCCHPEWSCSH